MPEMPAPTMMTSKSWTCWGVTVILNLAQILGLVSLIAERNVTAKNGANRRSGVTLASPTGVSYR